MLTNAHLALVRALLLISGKGESRVLYASVLDQDTVSPNVLRKRTDAEHTLAVQEYNRLRYHFPRNGGFDLSRRFNRSRGSWIITVTYTGPR